MIDSHKGSFSKRSADYLLYSKQFRNGDSYSGQWKGDKPDGDGKYVWEMGSWYEGTWQFGKQHGVGKHVWPSGTTYQGEWQAGSIHGVGTMTSPTSSSEPNPSYLHLGLSHSFGGPGTRNQHLAYNTGTISRYQGSWVADKRHGLGKQTYAKGDIYEGLWKQDLQDGPGRYMFTSGDEYDGEWREGLMAGQGTFVWSGGERYDGHWKNGKPDGLGLLSLQDGTTYDAQWRAGKRHGVCVYSTPAELKRRGSRRDSILAIPSAPSLRLPSRKGSLQLHSYNEFAEEPSVSPRLQKSNLSGSHAQHPISQDALHSILPSPKEQQAKSGSTFVRVYHFGNVVKEWQVSREDAVSILSHLAASRPGTGISRLLRSKTGGNGSSGGPKEGGTALIGEAISKDHQAYSIMLALQLGMRYSITRVTPEPGFKQLDSYDFQQKVKQLFPRGGSEMTAVHSGEEFTWKDYAPMAFRKLREFFEIDAGSYMLSLCSDAALRLLNSPGKSGAVFLLSNDDQYFVKTVKKNEVDLLCSILPRYYNHVVNHPHTLLTKFYGLHKITLKSGRKVHLVVMANLFNRMQLHQRYDIKGSRLGRSAGAEAKQQAHTILKDLDLDMTFSLEDGWLDRLMYQLQADCNLLEQCRIMDYSLLLGIHYRNRQAEGKTVSNFSEVCPDEEYNVNFPRLCDRMGRSKLPEDARSALLDLLRARLNPNQQHAAQRQQQHIHTRSLALLTHVRKKHCRSALLDLLRARLNRNQQRVAQRQQQSLSTTDALALEQGSSRVQLGVNMPAKAIPSSPGGQPEDVVLYFGIIDILQDYNKSKMIEHNLKSIWHDSYAVSVTDPHTYSHRFQSFLMSIFS